jgi:hypothetical protein
LIDIEISILRFLARPGVVRISIRRALSEDGSSAAQKFFGAAANKAKNIIISIA